MRNRFVSPRGVLFLFSLLLTSPVQAAELLDVKPVVAGSSVAIEVTADIPMTYTYYKVPGQARAVVDIADADPEKVEPLIVVNKGAVSSISVDKAMIGDMTVSRLVFNLVSESDISVKHASDRKTLNVTFGGDAPAAAQSATPPPVSVVAPAAVPVPNKPVEPAAAAVAPEPKEPVAVAASSKPASKEEEDPLGLNEPQPATVAAPSKPVSKEEQDPLGLDEPQPAAVPVKEPAPAAAVVASRIEPVVPAAADQVAPAMVVVKGIVIGASFIEIQTKGAVEKFTAKRLSKPERLSIEIAGTSTVSVNTIQVKRFGVSKIRIGTTPGLVRVVLDTAKPAFPKYEVVTVENGLRINFK